MRWLAILAILIAGAVGYLRCTLTDGVSAPQREKRPQALPEVEPVAEPAPTPEVKRDTPAPVAAAPAVVAPPKPTALDRVVAAAVDKPVVAQIDAATEEEVPWTEQERWQSLWTANGRFEKGNYPGAVEKAMEIARRHPPWQEDAWKVAIKAHCGMSEADKANALFAKMTVPEAIDEVVKFCSEQNIKLAKK